MSLSAEWCCVEGQPEKPIEAHGRRADFIVAARPLPDDEWPVQQGFKTALLRTERPVLVVPPDPAQADGFGRRVAVAWRDDDRAAKALLATLRCQAHVERLFLLAGVRGGSPPPGLPPILVEHGAEAEMRVLPIEAAPFGARLLAEAHAAGADLLVMGAYAHSRLRELVFGGVTRFMLQHADLPLLMRH
jgi:nucleotide-binding universal stress UspA family protein